MRSRDANGRWLPGAMPDEWRWKRRKFGPDEERAICEAKRNGATYPQLCDQYGIARTTLWRILAEGGVLDPVAYRRRVDERRWNARTKRIKYNQSDDAFIAEQLVIGMELLCEEKDRRNRALRRITVDLHNKVKQLEAQLERSNIVPCTKRDAT